VVKFLSSVALNDENSIIVFFPRQKGVMLTNKQLSSDNDFLY